MAQGTALTGKTKKLHYAWVIASTGTLVLFSCLGLGRFSLGMLLPSMGASLNWNYSQMGFIGTGNFIGYMVAVFFAGMIAKRIGARWTVILGLVLVGGSMMLISQTRGFIKIMILYLTTGIGSGFAFIPMLGLVSHWFSKTTRGRASGAMISGNGAAIVFSGIFIPWINTSLGAQGWRTGWLVMGIISICIAGLATCLLRNHPREKSLLPLGAPNDTTLKVSESTNIKKNNKWTLTHLGFVYFFFGATYAVFATFIVTEMVNERGFGDNASFFL